MCLCTYYVYTYVCTMNTCIYVNVYMHILIYVRMCAFIYVSAYVCI